MAKSGLGMHWGKFKGFKNLFKKINKYFKLFINYLLIY
jgi:hypothetical protein